MSGTVPPLATASSDGHCTHSAMLIMDALLFVECNFVQAYSIIMENDLRSNYYQILHTQTKAVS